MTGSGAERNVTEWFVVGPNRKPYGPVSLAKLREYVAGGRITRSTYVFRQGTSEWVTAERVDGLFEPEPAQPVKEVPPTPPAAPEVQRDPIAVALMCPTCHVGSLRKERPYRMSTPAVVTGYALLVLSVVIALPTSLMLIDGVLKSTSIRREPVALQSPTDAALQSGLIWDLQVVPAWKGLMLALAMLVVGVLLVMSKTTLRCNRCGTSIAAS